VEFMEEFNELISLSPQRLYGIFLFFRPAFFIKDADLLKQILIKDFDRFMNHDKHLSRGADGMFVKSIVLLEDDAWRKMRYIL
jgi:hypothetical protein